MLRQVLVILLGVTLLVAAGLMAMSALGWWAPGQGAAGKVTAHTRTAPVISAPHQQDAGQPGTLNAQKEMSPPETVAAETVPAAPPSHPAAPDSPPAVERPAPSVPSVSLTVLPPPQAAPALPGVALAFAAPALPQARLTFAPPVAAIPPLPLSNTPLGALNAVRAVAGQPPVRSDSRWDAECLAHARYLTLTDTGQHAEDPADPHYSQAGANCAHGHYYVTGRAEATGAQAIGYWANGPFHLPQLIDPRLARVSLAVAHDPAGGIHTAVVLDAKRGRSGPSTYPVRYPAPGQVVAVDTLAENEYPDALPGCPGYAHPVGAPILLMQGYGGAATGARLRVNGAEVPACLLTAPTFTGGSGEHTRVGRSVLAAQGVSALLPRAPLPSGAQVQVEFSTPSGPASWSFSTR